MEKLIRITLLALVASLLSALYISQVHAADVVPNEIKQPGTQPSEAGNLYSRTDGDRNLGQYWQQSACIIDNSVGGITTRENKA